MNKIIVIITILVSNIVILNSPVVYASRLEYGIEPKPTISSSNAGNSEYIILDNDLPIDKQIYGKSDVIIVIRKSIDLKNNCIEIPYGCTLLFQGGSLKNGTIIGNNTFIDAPNYRIFENSVSLNGCFSNPYMYADWFEDLQVAVDLASQNTGTILLSAKIYEFGKSLVIGNRVTLIGCGNEGPSKDGMGTILCNRGGDPVILIQGSKESPKKNITIKNLKIKGNGENSQIGSNVGIYVGPKASCCQFENITIYSCSNGIELDNTWNLRFENVNTYYCNSGFFLNSNTKAPLTTTIFSTCVAYNGEVGFNFIGDMSSTTIESCATDGCKTGMILGGCLGVTISSFMFEKHSEYGIFINSLDCYATINGLCPRSPKSDEVTHIRVDRVGRVTFSNLYISKYVTKDKGYSVVVDPSSTSKTCFYNCNINGRSINLDSCVLR